MAKEPPEYPEVMRRALGWHDKIKNEADWKQVCLEMAEAANREYDNANVEMGENFQTLTPHNHLNNGAFTRWSAIGGPPLPDFWALQGVPGAVTQVAPRTGAFTGLPYAINSGCQIQAAGTRAGIAQDVRFEPGRLHTLSGWVRCVAGANGGIITVTCAASGDVQSKPFRPGLVGIQAGAWVPFPSPALDGLTIRVPLTDATVTVALLAEPGCAVAYSDLAWQPGIKRHPDLYTPAPGDAEEFSWLTAPPGGGAGAALGTIGGAGPAGAAQVGWVRVRNATGGIIWMPYWQ